MSSRFNRERHRPAPAQLGSLSVDGPQSLAASAEFGSQWDFVGRKAQLDQFESFFRQVLFGRRASSVLVYGPAGIGKRALVGEFIRRLEKSGGRFRSIEAHPSDRPLSFVRSLLNSRFREELASPQPAQSLVATLRKLVPTQEVVEVTVAVSDLIGVELPGRHTTLDWLRRLLADPQRRHPFLADILRRLLLREVEQQPLVAVFHGPDKADQESLAILSDVFVALKDMPLLVVAIQRERATVGHVNSGSTLALRPGDETMMEGGALFPSPSRGFIDADTDVNPDVTHADGVLRRLSGFLDMSDLDPDATHLVGSDATLSEGEQLFGLPLEVLEVSRLTDVEVEMLVRRALAHVDNVPEELVGMLLTDVKGIPGNLTPKIQALVSHGIFDQTSAGWVVRIDKMRGDSLPSDLDSLAQARLRALPAKHLRLLEIASVVGSEFSVSSVLALMRLEPEVGEVPFFEKRTENRLRQVLLELQGRDIIVYKPEPGHSGDESFQFQSERERELVSQNVDPQRGGLMHRVLAQIAERRGASPEVVAHHWRAGNARRRAAITMLSAGINHVERFEAKQAIEVLEAAITELDSDEGDILSEGLQKLASACLMAGDHARVHAVCDRLAQHAYAMGTLEYGAEAFLLKASAAMAVQDFHGADGNLSHAMALADQGDNEDPDVHRQRAQILEKMATNLWIHGQRIPDAFQMARRAYEVHEHLRDTAGMARSMLSLGNIEVAQRRSAEAARYFEEAVVLAEKANLQEITARAHNALGDLARSQGQVKAAQKHWTAALELSRALGDRSLRASVLSNLGALAWHRREGGLAGELLRRAADLARSIGDFKISSDAYGLLAVIALDAADIRQAVLVAQASLEDARKSAGSLRIARALRNLGEVLATSLHFDDNASVPGSLGAIMGPAECLSLAEHSFRESISMLESMGSQPELGAALGGYQTFLLDRGRHVEAEGIARKLEQLQY